jgi:hypothetical protein
MQVILKRRNVVGFCYHSPLTHESIRGLWRYAAHKNYTIVGEKPVVRTREKLHQPKKWWFLHFVMMQIRRKSLNNEADLTLLLLKFHHLHSKMTRSARNDPPFSLRNDTIVLS